MNAAEKHNALAREFVLKVASETNSYSEMMVVIETIILSAMLLLSKRDHFPPHGAVEMVEMSVQQATERFSKLEG
ncbi:hypothetical protein V9K92_10260 [Phyllobacterium sp. CCNWLW109]|uniref:hypothetical protein n=1 Tax=Phyllobacterium sp. CCNWLW109 TaxID=3127479 RepID=UPI003077DAF0